MVNVAANDIDNDGIPELALAHGFSLSYKHSTGIISLLTHQGAPTASWSIREIDRTPTAHRLLRANIDGSGTNVLVNAPLFGSDSLAPEYRDRLSLFWYKPGIWKRQVITDAEKGIVHGIHAAPWHDSSRDSILSASFLGIHAHELSHGRWTRIAVVTGDSSPWPNSGASEIQIGHLKRERFLTTNEPWHGHQVVVYRRDCRRSIPGKWTRQVIDSSVKDAHAIVTADLDGDGFDEIVVGERSGDQNIYLYQLDDKSHSRWSKHILDDTEIAAAGYAISGLNANGKPDVVCIGSNTENLKWYDNQSRSF